MCGPVHEDQSGHVVGPRKGQHDHEVPPLVTGAQVVQLAWRWGRGRGVKGGKGRGRGIKGEERGERGRQATD